MSPNKHQKDLPISIREDTPISSRMFLIKGLCLSLHFCFKVNQSVYFYFALFILHIRRIKITPADLRRKPKIFQNTFQTLISKCSRKRVSFQAIIFNNEFHIIPFSNIRRPSSKGVFLNIILPSFQAISDSPEVA